MKTLGRPQSRLVPGPRSPPASPSSARGSETILTRNASFAAGYGCLAVMFAVMAFYSQSFLPDAEHASGASSAGDRVLPGRSKR